MTERAQSGLLSGENVARLSLLHWAMVLTAAALFGVSFLFIKMALIDIPPMSVAVLRCIVAAPVAWAVLKIIGGSMPSFAQSWRLFLVLGVLTVVVPFAAIAYGQDNIETALGGMLFGSLPVFNVLLVPLIARDEAFHPVRLLGAMVGFVGLLFVMAPKYSGGMDTNLWSMLLMVLAAASYAGGVGYARRDKAIHPIAMIVGQLTWGGVALLALAIYLDAPWPVTPSLTAWIGVAGIGVLGTAVAPTLLFLLIRMIGGTRVALIPLLMPIFATLIGVLVVGEQIHLLSYLGLGIVLSGAVLIAGSQQRNI